MEGYLGETKLNSYVGTPFVGFGPKEWAMMYIARYSAIDGDHHKTWVFDQVARILLGTPILLRLAKWSNGHEEYRFTTGEPSLKYLEWVEGMKGEKDSDGEYEYSWEVGVAP